MNMQFHHLFLLSSIAMASTGNVKAELAHLDAHVHGLAELMIAIEGQTVDIQLQSPAMNLVGFEHKAHSESEIDAVQRAESLLNSPNLLFSFKGGQCSLIETSVDVSSVLESEHSELDGHHHEHETDEEHHNEVSAHYQYHCNNTDELAAVSVNMFKDFPAIKQTRVLWLTESKQAATTLDSDNYTVIFK